MKENLSGNFGNQILYDMCVVAPKHTDDDVISGKVWLIGRAYAAAIERRATGRYAEEARRDETKDLHRLIAPEIRNSPLDHWLASISEVEAVDEGHLPQVLAIHWEFVELLKRLTGRQRPSFASKYLHFHQPRAFFIYDSRASKEIRKKVPGRGNGKPPAGCEACHNGYAAFVRRCLQYRDEQAKARNEHPMTPRELDRELLQY
ncbi:hypothetical protein [Methyloligella solikamskensis]|uniref:Uncharacterized protein n=1 Tax=Methyloligella solikamskensis TaxID=1177756 RepID=A0ABW3JBN5_9HYPH